MWSCISSTVLNGSCVMQSCGNATSIGYVNLCAGSSRQHARMPPKRERREKMNRDLNAKKKGQRQIYRRTRIEGRSQWSLSNAVEVLSLTHWLGSMHLAGDVLRPSCVVALPSRCCQQMRLFGIMHPSAIWVSSPVLRRVASFCNHHGLVERSLQRLLRRRLRGPRRRLELPHLSRLLTDIVDLLLGFSVNEGSRWLGSRIEVRRGSHLTGTGLAS